LTCTSQGRKNYETQSQKKIPFTDNLPDYNRDD
jgi:hypothetical protein